MTALVAYLERCGIAFDEAVNVLTGGQLGQTVSLRAATAASCGRRWGCWLCWVLSVVVQHNHCALQLSGVASAPAITYLRAGCAFAVAIGSVVAILRCLWGFT